MQTKYKTEHKKYEIYVMKSLEKCYRTESTFMPPLLLNYSQI